MISINIARGVQILKTPPGSATVYETLIITTRTMDSGRVHVQ